MIALIFEKLPIAQLRNFTSSYDNKSNWISKHVPVSVLLTSFSWWSSAGREFSVIFNFTNNANGVGIFLNMSRLTSKIGNWKWKTIHRKPWHVAISPRRGYLFLTPQDFRIHYLSVGDIFKSLNQYLRSQGGVLICHYWFMVITEL